MIEAGVVAVANAQSPGADSFNPIANLHVAAMAVQTDGKVLLGGGFSTLGGSGHNNIGRVTGDGIVESNFTTSASASIYSLAVFPDGKILVGGDFTSLSGKNRYALGRLNTDGTVDTNFWAIAFDPAFGGPSGYRAQAISVQPDGKIIVGGKYTDRFFGTSVGYVYRLTTNGASDTFNSGAINGRTVATVAQQRDGKILIGGGFTQVGGTVRYGMARLNTNGTLDPAFDAQIDNSVDTDVLSLVVQPDDRILVAGVFKTVGGSPHTNLARLNPDGSIDNTFNPFTSSSSTHLVRSQTLQADGKIIISGTFSALCGVPRSNIGRLYPDGSLDVNFNPGADLDIYGVALQPDGKILAGGTFSQLGGQSCGHAGRLTNTGSAAQFLDFSGSTITWFRGGSCCEIWRASFDSSTNGTNWVNLGATEPIPGGWQMTGVSLSSGVKLRARGYTTGGGDNGSEWIVENLWPPQSPTIAKDNLFGLRSNRFSFNWHGPLGATVVVEGSTNTSDWSPLATNVVFSDPLYFSDPTGTGVSAHFYRLHAY